MNYRALNLPVILSLSLLACNGQAQDTSVDILWRLNGLKNPESVVYDTKSGSLYVSNINGDPLAKDHNGFIAKVSLQGKIEKLHWATGLDAPKGLAIYGDYLFVADIDQLVQINMRTGAISKRFPDAGAKFFNDVAAADDGSIYVSDSMTNTIHRLRDGKLTRWLHSAKLRSPNGLFTEPERMLVAAWGNDQDPGKLPGQVLAVSLLDKSITVIGNQQTQGTLDGIEAKANGAYFITDWTAGKLMLLQPSGRVGTLLTLEKGMADLTYLKTQRLLVLPMLKTGKLIACKVK